MKTDTQLDELLTTLATKQPRPLSSDFTMKVMSSLGKKPTFFDTLKSLKPAYIVALFILTLSLLSGGTIVAVKTFHSVVEVKQSTTTEKPTDILTRTEADVQLYSCGSLEDGTIQRYGSIVPLTSEQLTDVQTIVKNSCEIAQTEKLLSAYLNKPLNTAKPPIVGEKFDNLFYSSNYIITAVTDTSITFIPPWKELEYGQLAPITNPEILNATTTIPVTSDIPLFVDGEKSTISTFKVGDRIAYVQREIGTYAENNTKGTYISDGKESYVAVAKLNLQPENLEVKSSIFKISACKHNQAALCPDFAGGAGSTLIFVNVIGSEQDWSTRYLRTDVDTSIDGPNTYEIYGNVTTYDGENVTITSLDEQKQYTFPLARKTADDRINDYIESTQSYDENKRPKSYPQPFGVGSKIMVTYVKAPGEDTYNLEKRDIINAFIISSQK